MPKQCDEIFHPILFRRPGGLYLNHHNNSHAGVDETMTISGNLDCCLKLQQEKLDVAKDKPIHQARTVEIAQECHTQENLCFNEENCHLLENAVKESLSDNIKYKQQLDSL